MLHIIKKITGHHINHNKSKNSIKLNHLEIQKNHVDKSVKQLADINAGVINQYKFE